MTIDQPQEEYVSYAEKLNSALNEERNAFQKGQDKKSSINLSDREQHYAEAMAHLMNNEYFKSYLEFESIEIAKRLAMSFEPPEDPMFAQATLGEKLAFNKGRHFQMMYVLKTRQTLIKAHLALNRQQIKEE